MSDTIQYINENDINDIFDSIIDFYINEFCEKYHIEDLKTESQAIWNSCLFYLQRKCFPNNKAITDPIDIYKTKYNYTVLDTICNYYIYICFLYNKECNISGFCRLINISIDIVDIWGRNKEQSPQAFGIYKKLTDTRLEYLSGKLSDGKQNPVGLIAILNHYYGWNSPFVENKSDDSQTTKQINSKYNANLFIDTKQ